MNKFFTLIVILPLFLLPACGGGYQMSHRERVISKAERAHAEISQGYKRELSFIEQEKNKDAVRKRIKDEVLAKHDHPSQVYPFIAYKKQLNDAIQRLADHQHALIKYAYLNDLRHDISHTINKLEGIGRIISTDREYQNERIRFDERRLEAENNAAIVGLAGAAVGAIVGAACTPRETVVVHEPVVEVAYVPYVPSWADDVVEVEHVYEYY